MKRTTNYSKFFVALFCLFLLFVGFYKNSSFNDTFAEKFRLREKLISLSMNFKFLVVRDNFFSDIMYTQDHRWLNYIGENSLDDFQNVSPFTDDQLDTIHTKLLNIRQKLNERDIKFYLIVPPNKSTIYPIDLLKIAPKMTTYSRLDQVIAHEKTTFGIDLIDLRSELLQANATRSVFFSTDTHWNPYGSWTGYFKVASVISQDFPQIVVNPFENFTVRQQVIDGDLAKLSGNLLIEETSETLILQNPRKVVFGDSVLDNGIRSFTSFIDDDELPIALVFRDSFYVQLNQYLSQHFSKSVGLHSFKFDWDKVDEVKPDLVIYEITERYLDQLLRLP